jgi:Kef-type K+ transport system membrane component KefB
MKHAILYGLLLWIIGTVAIRLAGQHLLHPGRPLSTFIFYLVSFVLMALLIPRIPRSLKLEKDSQLAAISLLILPTLLLDPFSCLFFSIIFPNIAPASAGPFGGWMLICCAGAVLGAWLQR